MPAKADKKTNNSNFDSMNLSKPLMKAMANMGISAPTEIQVN